MFEEGRNCWKVAPADRLSVIVDAADYFATARKALLDAKRRIMLVGWDFDGRIGFHSGPPLEGEPETVGEFLLWLVERTPELEVYLLRWDMGALKSLFRGSTAVTAVKWALHPRIHLKLDGHHPTASSHHQKLIAIDDCLAFCGGIDMTGNRWDTRAHLHDDARRVEPDGTPYRPWHDATTMLSGPIAAVIGRECRDRWERATGDRLAAIDDVTACWPDGVEPSFEVVDVAFARSHPEMDDQQPVREIEQLFLDQIAGARRIIYLESQYFASRRVAEAIGRRLDQPDCPEIVIVNPLAAQGWLEPVAMDSARARLVAALRKRDTQGRLAIYHPFTSGGEAIYVHAKVSIFDDQSVRVGSANLNNRSMRLDTECDVAIDTTRHPGRGLEAQVAAIRSSLLAEHLGVAQDRFEAVFRESGSVIAAIERLRGPGRSLRRYEIPNLSDVEAWLADNEVLDPEGPEEMFEPLTKRSLFRWLSPPPDAGA
jgi:phosphatidylserine/phosphatidylglycerophosphate/cardiolipin synthase-like enzyme